MANLQAITKSIISLLTYQLAMFLDKARVIVVCWCRQAGKDFAAACKAVDDAVDKGSTWYIVSLTQRQADATFAKCKQIATAYHQALKMAGQLRYEDEEFVEYDAMLGEHFRYTRRVLHLPNGGMVVSLPGRNPDSLAGLTGNVIFTEFGLFPNGGYDHWRVIFPLTTRGYQVIVISTPRGKNTKFFELVSDPETYSVHRVDINDAVAGGLVLRDNNGDPTTVEVFRKLYGDEIGWQREYMLEFTGDLDALVKWSQLQAAASAAGSVEFTDLFITDGAGWRADFFNRFRGMDGRLELGWDVARRNNLSVVWANVSRKGRPRELAALAVMDNCSFALQRQVVRAAMDTNRRNVGCGDATGLGMDSNETLEAAYPKRWESVTFTAAAKAELGSLLRTAYDDSDQVLPDMETHKYVATDIYGIQAERGGDRLKLVETPNPLLEGSHCDVGYANGLARKAVSIKGSSAGLAVP